MTMTDTPVRDAEQEPDERPGSDELGDHVEHAYDNGADGRRRANAARVEPRREHVGQGVLAEVPQGLGHEQEHHEVRYQEPYREVETGEAL